MKHVIDVSRRRLLKTVAAGVAVIPVVGLCLRPAIAADLPLVTEDDPTAKALKYVSDASKANGAKPGSTAPIARITRAPLGLPKVAASCFPERR